MKIFEIGTTATLQWNLNGVPDGSTIYNVFYYINKKKIQIFNRGLLTNTYDKSLSVEENNQFDRNRLGGHLKLSNGNGKLTVTLLNVQYNESGVFMLDMTVVGTPNIQEKSNSTLDVQGL